MNSSAIRYRLHRAALTVGIAGLLTACGATSPVLPEGVTLPRGDADKLLVVDCLLPGQIRKLGSKLTYLSPRRPIKTTAADCEIRGGEYVAYDRANYATALKVWLPPAQEGDPDAQVYVGEIYEKGLGLEPDYALAAQWYRKAAEQGNSRAQINLGQLYEQGQGVPKDPVQALNWYRRASGLTSDQLAFSTSIKELEREAETMRRQVTQSRQDVAAARQQASISQQEADSLRRQLRTTQQQLDSRVRSLEDLSRELEKTRQQLRERSVAPGASPDNADIRALQDKLLAQQRELEQKSRELVSIQEETNQQRSRLGLELLNVQRQWDEQIKAAEKERQELEREIALRDQETKQLRRQLETTEKQYQTRLERLQQAERDQTQTRLDLDRQRTLPDSEAVRRQTEELQRRLEERQATIQEQRQELSYLQQETQRQQARYAAELKEAQRKQAELELQVGQRQAQAGQAGGQQLAMAGPVIEIIDPPIAATRGSEQATVTMRSATPQREIVGKVSAPGGLLSLTVNDQRYDVEPGGAFRAVVPLPGTENPVTVTAVDKQGQLATVNFTLMTQFRSVDPAPTAKREPAPAEPLPAVSFGRYYALLIGNNNYSAFPKLKTAVNDAKAVASVLRGNYGFETQVLVDADRYAILSALNEYRQKLTDQDNFLLYYAGHGELDSANQRGHWLPVNAEPGSTANWISNVQVTDILNAMSAKHVMVIADSCYSGTLANRSVTTSTEGGRSYEMRKKWLDLMVGVRSRTVLTSGGLAPVLDSGGGDHSVFAKYLLEALQGNRALMEGPDLYRQVAAPVKAAAAKLNVDQDPQYAPIKYAGDLGAPFFFARLN